MGGNILSQLIEIGFAPITTRLFTPENFGVLALFGAMVGILSKVGSLCYDRAVLLPKSKKDALNVMALAIVVLVSFSFTMQLFYFLFRKPIASLLKAPGIETWLVIVPLGILLTGSVQLARSWRLREKEFKSIATSRLMKSLFSVSVKITIGYFIGSVSGGLIGGVLVGTTVAFFTLVALPGNLDIARLKTQITTGGIKSVAVVYKKFPLFASWNALFNFLSQYLIIFVFSAFFSPAVAGLYSLGNRVLKQPIVFISDSIRNVYFQKAASQVAHQLPVFHDLVKLTAVLFFAGIIPFGSIAMLGKSFFELIFGENWGTAGTYMQIMAPWFLLIFTGGPAKIVYEALQIQDQRLAFNLSSAIFRAVAVISGAWLFKDPMATIAIFVTVNVLFEMIIIGWALTMAFKHDNATA